MAWLQYNDLIDKWVDLGLSGAERRVAPFLLDAWEESEWLRERYESSTQIPYALVDKPPQAVIRRMIDEERRTIRLAQHTIRILERLLDK